MELEYIKSSLGDGDAVSRRLDSDPMTSAAASTTSDFNGAQRRIPKLAVRNKLADDNFRPPSTPSPPRSDNDSDERTTPSSYASSLRTHRHGFATYHSDDSRESRTDGQSQDGTPTKPTRTESASIKKRGLGMFGFLAIKEPSTSAWEEYAEVQKKFAAERGGRAIGMPGVSSRQLPAHVPKTNSQWDGLPHRRKRQFQTSFSAGQAETSSAGSVGSSSGYEPSIRTRFGSLTTKPLFRQDLKGESRQSSSREPAATNLPVKSPTAVYPAFHDDAVDPWDEPSLPQQRRNTAIAPWDEPPLQQKRNIAVAPWDEPPAAPGNLHML
ncbi:hypothetical protein EJ03DRAFT_125959 [Teratosphaeria nubilosa]|uniref:Uncharacterized protein n=1 Tax=Teratosphaeria nubilosa TaxID=161662 RepID=A0A6G1LKB5_9PEZI|nr:hypothetical protein EJ03DRAFT_125959 [Teratosphaeria nubilosa]